MSFYRENPFPYHEGSRVMFDTNGSMPHLDGKLATITKAIVPRYDTPESLGGPQWTFALLSDAGEHYTLGVHPSWFVPV